MTTTELALVEDAEVIEAQPLNKTEAKKLDRRIRATSDKTVASHERTLALFDELKDLLVQARDGEIHKALGLKSWTVYLRDAVNVQVPDRGDRKALAQFFSGEGMSQRAIASALNVSQKTIDRDLEDEEVEEGATVTSLDGAERPKTRTKVTDAEQDSEPDVIDAEVVEPMKAVDIVEAFNDEMANLWGAHSELNQLLKEEKWAGARRRVANANLNNLQEVITNLQLLIDDLMNGAS